MHKLFFTLLMVGVSFAQPPLPHQEPLRRIIPDQYDYDEVADGPPTNAFNDNLPQRRYPSPTRPQQEPGQLNPGSQFVPKNDDCRGRTRTRAHEKYSDLYYQLTGCDDSQAVLRSCPNGLLYSGGGHRHSLINVCDYPHNVEAHGMEKHNPPISTEHCDWLYGIFGHETSCTRYWTCWNGTAAEQFCVGGLLYNEETHACDWPQNVVGCQKHPLCKDDANGNVPLGKSCNRYWACQGGYPRLQRCPAMLVFDRLRKRCVAPPTEDCDVPPTTSAPREKEDGGERRQQSFQGGAGGGGGQGRRGNEGRRREEERPGNDRGQGGGQQLPFNLPQGATLLSRPPQN